MKITDQATTVNTFRFRRTTILNILILECKKLINLIHTNIDKIEIEIIMKANLRIITSHAIKINKIMNKHIIRSKSLSNIKATRRVSTTEDSNQQ